MDNLPEPILHNCEEFIQQSEQDRKTIASRSLAIHIRLADRPIEGNYKVSKKSSKNNKDQTKEIEQSEIN
jgi:hypothetical protein